MNALTHAPRNVVVSVNDLKIGQRVGVKSRAGLVHGIVLAIRGDYVSVSNDFGARAVVNSSRVVLLP